MFTSTSQLLGTAATAYGALAALSVLLQARQMLKRHTSCGVSARFLALYAGGYATDAEQAVVDHLAAEPGMVTWASPPSPSGWVASIRSGGGEGADPATVRFRKSRAFPGCQLHQVEFADPGGQAQRLLVRTWQQPDGTWVADPIGGGSGADPYRARPWVNFAAQWNTGQFAAGGTVTGHGADAAHLVRLTFADGTTIEDLVHNGVVFFYTSPGAAFPARIQILNSAGDILADYDEFTNLE